MPNPLAHHRRRIGALFIAVLAVGAPACASFRGADGPGCTGTRRPANPHGSVLEPGASAAASAGAPITPCGRTAP